MPQIRYLVGGVENVETIPDALVDYYQSRLEYTVVVTEEYAAALTGAELLEAARNAGVEALTTLTADEKREAIVEATAPHGEPYKPSEAELAAHEAEKYGTPDPEPAAAGPAKRRTAATDKES